MLRTKKPSMKKIHKNHTNETCSPLVDIHKDTYRINRSYKKKAIPKAVREQVWLEYIGKTFESKCTVDWCKNIITPFQYECGHNIPESKGGTTTLDNLRPICSNCNASMKDTYTIDEWITAFRPKKKGTFFQTCFGKTTTVDPLAHIKSSKKVPSEPVK